MQDVKIVGEQRFRDDSSKVRITVDMPRIAWLILKQQFKSNAFYNIIDDDSDKETNLLTS